jgi:predicted extracellular nuclease/2',3'-cyclic-nucleotide 2'-phosphodiesterase (5'-nucleotidase family)
MSASFTLQILHGSDFEAGLAAAGRAPQFAAIVDRLEEEEPNSITLSSGDNFIPSPFLNAGADPALSEALRAAMAVLLGVPSEQLEGVSADLARVDLAMLGAIGVQASALGNHEFDLGTTVLANAVDFLVEEGATSPDWTGPLFPYLSANLDFSEDPALSRLFTEELLPADSYAATAETLGSPESIAEAAEAHRIAPWATIEEGGETIGVLGLTTQVLEGISSTGSVQVKDPAGDGGVGNTDELAAVLQPYVDEMAAQGVDKIVLLSHLQQYQLELAFAAKLRGVDVIVAGGSHALFADDGTELRLGDTLVEGYPQFRTGADGNTVAVVNTASEYGYVGRLVVGFDEAGNVLQPVTDAPESRPYAATDETVESLWGSEDPYAEGTRGAVVQGLVEAVSGVINDKDSEVYGFTEVFLEGRRAAVRAQETNFGSLTADANLAHARETDAEVAVSIKNGGGIRAEIGAFSPDPANPVPLPPQENEAAGKPEGGISRLDIENSLRFNNGLTLLTVTAEGLKQVLENAVSGVEPGTTPGAFPQVSGLEFSFDATLPAGSRVRSLTLVDEEGTPTEVLVQEGEVAGNPAREIRLVTLNFLADGGDGYGLDTLGTDRVDLFTGTETDFMAEGREQLALAEYLQANHGTQDAAYSMADAGPETDERVQNLAFREDTVLEGAPELPGKEPPLELSIQEIQGAGHRSAHEGEEVRTTGIVTALDSNGFWVQDADGDGDDATSDAVFVFTGDAPSVAIGNAITLTATVAEFLPGNNAGNLTITELVSPSDITLDEASAPLPAATLIGGAGRRPPTGHIEDDGFTSFDPSVDGIDFFESLEGMLITVDNAVAVSGTNGFGETWVLADRGEASADSLNARGGITLSERDDNPERIQVDTDAGVLPGFAPLVNTGDRLVNLEGVLSYDFGNYELVPTRPFLPVDGGMEPEATELVKDERHLLVASYNTENLDPGDGARIGQVAQQIVEGLNAPDVLALQEVQDGNGATDDGLTDASATYEALIEAIAAAGGPSYAYADIAPEDGSSGGEPGGNIRNGFLYDPSRVELVPGSLRQITDPDAFTDSRVPLVGDFRFGGETVSIVNIHSSSKGGGTSLYGAAQPPVNGSEEQRIAQAEAIHAFVQGLVEEDPRAAVMVLGDANEFDWNESQEILTGVDAGRRGQLLFDLALEQLPEEERYSYNFDGNAQALDHSLVSRALLNGAEYDIVHLNSEFADAERASDHDPSLVQLAMHGGSSDWHLGNG